MLKSFLGYFSNDLSIDLGTANTLIYVRGKGIVLNEPSVVAIREEPGRGGKVLEAVGGRGEEHARPHAGAYHRDSSAQGRRDRRLQRHREDAPAFHQEGARLAVFPPEPACLVCVPYGSTQVERRAIRESAEGAGARKVYLVEEPMAAAIGAGMPVHEARGSMVLDIGGGTSEVAVISLNGIVYAASVRIGGDRFDEAITNYVRRNYGILIGEATAERIKHEIGSAYPGQDVREISVKGPQSLRGRAAQLHAEQQRDPRGAARAAARHRRRREGRARANTARARRGRRGARHRAHGRRRAATDIDKLLTEETGLPVVIADEPLTCVARGGGRVLELLDEYGPSAFSVE